jgi:hypothetical protein
MSLEQASLLAQIISAIVVVASLVFVGIQLQQNTKAVRAASSQAHSATYLAINTTITNDERGFARIWREGLGGLANLSEDDAVRFIVFTSGFFRFFEASRVQWQAGQLDDEHWHTIEQQAISFSAQPGIKSFWQIRRHWHCEAFQNWFETLPTTEARPLFQREKGQEPVFELIRPIG